MNTSDKTPNKRGRPTVNVEWPDKVFTVNDVINMSCQPKLTGASIRMKIRKDMADGKLEKVGQVTEGVGRPRSTFAKTVLEQFGTHKLVHIRTRFQGKDAADV